jgi:hypothetical protein
MQHAEKLHALMRMMYDLPDVTPEKKPKEVKKDVEIGSLEQEIRYENFQAALDGALMLVAAGGTATINLKGSFESAVVKPELIKDKTLLSKPHPADCICPERKGKAGIASTVKRIGDAERDACLALLDERLASGHLTLEEFQSRADKALTARNQHELDYLTQDLPGLPKPAAAPESRRDLSVAVFLCRFASFTFPVMTAITIITGSGLAGGAVLAVIAGVAALLLSFLQEKG